MLAQREFPLGISDADPSQQAWLFKSKIDGMLLLEPEDIAKISDDAMGELRKEHEQAAQPLKAWYDFLQEFREFAGRAVSFHGHLKSSIHPGAQGLGRYLEQFEAFNQKTQDFRETLFAQVHPAFRLFEDLQASMNEFEFLRSMAASVGVARTREAYFKMKSTWEKSQRSGVL